ncbi:MAG: DUF4384 domain-containing protein [Candidatus Methylophosphatis roskildensis]
MNRGRNNSKRAVGPSAGVAALALATLALAGCAGQVKEETLQTAEEVKLGPEQAPFRSITNFSSALRCMDNHMISFGVRDVSVLVEDLADQTKKMPAGTRDMLISAVSQMTKRSQAIRLIAYGQDSGNLIGFLQAAEKKGAYSVIPQYDIKGSISQYDENVAKKEAGGGISIGEVFSYGRAAGGAATILGLDLTVLDTEDLSVVPGVTSSNSVLIYKSGKGLDADATYRKLGVNYTSSLAKSEGNAQALRNLIELASVELIGKLTRTPYWSCLGVDANSEPVKTEISDWFYQMTGDVSDLIAYFQYQMTIRGFYTGPVDGTSNDELANAIAEYREAAGLPVNSKLNVELFSYYLNADHNIIQAAHKAKKPVAQSAPAEPIKLAISSDKPGGKFRRGETIGLTVQPSRDAYVYCYLHDEKNKVQRFFPNRFSRDAKVRAAEPLQLPGGMRFQIAASDKGTHETIMCVATPTEALNALPDPFKAPDFEPVGNASLDQIRTAFSTVAGAGMGEAQFKIDVQ